MNEIQSPIKEPSIFFFSLARPRTQISAIGQKQTIIPQQESGSTI